MISNEDLLFYYNILLEIQSSNDSTSYENLSVLKRSLRDFFKLLTQNENQFFSSTYSRIVYSIDKFNIPKGSASSIFHFRFLANNLNRKSNAEEIQKVINIGLNSFSDLINFFDRDKVIDKSTITTHKIELPQSVINKRYEKKNENLDFISIILENKGKSKKESLIISGYNDILGTVKIFLDKKWQILWENLWKTAKLHLFNLNIPKESKDNIFFTNSNSIIIIEPDILIDATDLSNCFLNNGFSPIPYFLNRLIPSEFSPIMIQGNLINSIFDEIISNREITFDEAYDKAIKIKPLQIFAIANINIETLKEIKKWLRSNFEILKKRIDEIEGDLISIEPSFYSPIYGLQGRLDLLIEFENDNSRKIIIELKSGQAPNKDLSIRTSDGQFIKTGLWESHLAQTICYNMLLDSTFPNRTGSSNILYIADTQNPFRNAPNIIQKKQEIALARNLIVSFEKKILDGDFAIFKKILSESFDSFPKYIRNDINEIKRVFSESSKLEIDYFKQFFRFILSEIYAGKVGSDNDHNNNGKSSIWRDTLDDKITSMEVLSNLEIDYENSDFKKLHLTFLKSQTENHISSIRQGDLVILYPMSSNGTISPIMNQIIKGTVREISAEKLVLSLRNKLLRTDIFSNHNKWVIEPDSIESTDRYLFHSLFNFLSSDSKKKEALLGIREPEINEFIPLDFPNLTPLQNHIVSKAISSEDYFIIQGPPGTGKTSYILKTIAEYYFKNSNHNVLILAYTNRAVDEICSALTKIENLKFLRLGSKEATNFSENLISNLAENIPLRDLFQIFKDTRFFVSTVSSVLVNPEIFSMQSFELAIVDEASQILEPQLIGILSKVNKFILIGDEKQLPAVVLQDTEKLAISDESLQNIHLHNLSQSLFERLLRCCIYNGWSDSYGMLTEQARMHKDIQFLVNTLFYNNSLKLFNESGWQIEPLNQTVKELLSKEHKNELISQLSKNRIIFIDSDIERIAKKHHQEALRVKIILSMLVKIHKNDFDASKIGIITPFRAQCNEIYTQIPEHFREKITIDTVERFQGSERDIIIISFAINHSKMINQISSLFQINDLIIDRKLNVAITRAKKQLILLGSSKILQKSEVYLNLIELIKKHFCYVSSEEFKSYF
ncbi:MAG: AAA domain-containing protein [Candidatus Kapabacteria bacterium]|nr:AAA domain-containing protein [Candidatus Kapabacteria bacterium]